MGVFVQAAPENCGFPFKPQTRGSLLLLAAPEAPQTRGTLTQTLLLAALETPQTRGILTQILLLAAP